MSSRPCVACLLRIEIKVSQYPLDNVSDIKSIEIVRASLKYSPDTDAASDPKSIASSNFPKFAKVELPGTLRVETLHCTLMPKDSEGDETYDA